MKTQVTLKSNGKTLVTPLPVTFATIGTFANDCGFDAYPFLEYEDLEVINGGNCGYLKFNDGVITYK